jgi:electron transfer flavoprotein beta subunit
MKVVVFVEVAADVRVSPELDARSGRVREEWLIRELDPAGAHALALALNLKAVASATEVTVIHFGSPEMEPWLRQARARGCDRVVRVWDEEAARAGVGGKAVILAAAAEAAGFDLVLTGASGVVNSSGQLGVLLAESVRVPCVTQAVGLRPVEGRETMEIERGLEAGFRERVEADLPLVATVSGSTTSLDAAMPPAIPVSALIAAHREEIIVWDLADLGVPLEKVRHADRKLGLGRPRSRRPRLHPVAAPDSSLPAFDRILELVRGSVQSRQGRVVQESAEAIVDEIFSTLKDEGWLDHLRVPSSSGAESLHGEPLKSAGPVPSARTEDAAGGDDVSSAQSGERL